MFLEDELSLVEKLGIHDNFQLEVKLEYPFDPKSKNNFYFTDIYFFFPSNLNINPATYDSKRFYDDIRNYIRFKTPILPLDQILNPETQNSPLNILNSLINNRHQQDASAFGKNVQYESKMLACILRASLRESAKLIQELIKKDAELDRINGLNYARSSIQSLQKIIQIFRSVTDSLIDSNTPRTLLVSLRLVDEFCSLATESFGIKLLRIMENWPRDLIRPKEYSLLEGETKCMISDETRYRIARAFRSNADPNTDNEELIYRRGLLKRFVFTNLFLEIQREQSISRWQQLLFGIAAGLSMLFATAVTFLAQTFLAQISWAFFAVIVISYIFKDRIKEGFKYFFSQLMNKKLYDQAIAMIDAEDGKKIGRCYQKIQYVPEEKVSLEVMRLRNLGRTEILAEREFKETVLYFRNAITLYSERIYKGHDRISAVNHIFRYNIRHLLRNMDEPTTKVELYDPKNDAVNTIQASKTYHMNIIFSLTGKDNQTESIKIRLILNRNGIKRVEQLDENGTTWKVDSLAE